MGGPAADPVHLRLSHGERQVRGGVGGGGPRGVISPDANRGTEMLQNMETYHLIIENETILTADADNTAHRLTLEKWKTYIL